MARGSEEETRSFTLNQPAEVRRSRSRLGQEATRFKVRLVEIISNPDAAKLVSDPMRRAILNLLRQRALTESELAESLGLTDATVNYHLRLLMQGGFLTIPRRVEEGHGIMQKFYAPGAYLYLPDVTKLPKEVARYYYPINVERIRGVLSVQAEGLAKGLTGDVDGLGEDLARELVHVARAYSEKVVVQGDGERLVSEIYSKALSRLSQK